MTTVQVQVRVPEELARQLDRWVNEGRFVSRSDAIKAIVSLYAEREKTRKFYAMLERRNKDAREKPRRLVSPGGKLSDSYGAWKMTDEEETRITGELSKGWRRTGKRNGK